MGEPEQQAESGEHDDRSVLVRLHEETTSKAAALSERQFIVTIYVATLHLTALGALFVHEDKLRWDEKLLALASLTALQGLVVSYMCNKCRDYWRSVRRRNEVEALLLAGLEARLPSFQAVTVPTTELSDQQRVWRGRVGHAARERLVYWIALLRAGSGGSATFVALITASYLVLCAAVVAHRGSGGDKSPREARGVLVLRGR